MGGYGPYGAVRGAPGPRGRGLRWVFVGIGVALLALGVVLFAVAVDPSAFGARRSAIFPFGGGILGAVLVLWGALLLVRVAWWASRSRLWSGGAPGRRFDPAIITARQRYARGEITREQFEQMVSDLRRPPGPLP